MERTIHSGSKVIEENGTRKVIVDGIRFIITPLSGDFELKVKEKLKETDE